MARKRKICLPITVVAGGKTYAPGEPVPIDAEEAEELIARHGEVEPNGKPVKEPARPKGKALEEAIASVFKDLDPENEDHFTKSGKPVVGEIEKRLGFDVTPEERDAVWAKHSQTSTAPAA